MKFIDNTTKPIYLICSYDSIYYLIDRNTGLLPEGYRNQETLAERTRYSNDTCVSRTETNETIAKKLAKHKLSRALASGDVLCFDKSSKFPRTKLANTEDYSRCIKPAKASAIVIPDFSGTANPLGETFVLYEADDCFIARSSSDTSLKTFKIPDPMTKNSSCTFTHFIEANNLVKGSLRVVSNSATFNIIDRALYDLYTKFETGGVYDGKEYVCDSDVDKALNKKLDSLDLDAINTLDQMFSSADDDVVNMGMRLIANYNIAEFPLTIKTLLVLNANKIYEANAYGSTVFKQVLKTLELGTLKNIPTFPMCLKYIPTTKADGSKMTTTNEDKELFKSFTLQKRDEHIGKLRAKQAEVIAKYNLNVEK